MDCRRESSYNLYISGCMYAEPSQTSKTDLFAKIVNGVQTLTISTKYIL